MKRLLVLMLFVLCAMVGHSQEHMTFKGVPIDGPLKTYVANMQKAGFTLEGVNDGIAYMKGDFAGRRNCTVAVVTLKSIDVVSKIAVLFEAREKWEDIHSTYTTLKEMLTEKYGSPSECEEKFTGYRQPTEGRDKMYELKMDRCKFNTVWSTDKGRIEMKIVKGRYDNGMVMLSYYDKINTTLVKSKAMDDL